MNTNVTISISPGCHTMGNLINFYMMRNDENLVCSYKVPHPLSKSVELTMQINSEKEALQHIKIACDDICEDLTNLSNQFITLLGDQYDGHSFPLEFQLAQKKIEVRKNNSVSDSSMC